MNKENFARRRQRLMNLLGKQDAVILFGASEQLRNGDVHYPFRQNSTFYYYTGYSEPDAVAFLLPGRKGSEYVLFNLVKDPQMERWVGQRIGQEGAIQYHGVELAFDIAHIEEKAVELLEGRKKIYYEMSQQTNFDLRLMDWIRKLREKARRSDSCPSELVDLKIKSGEMRLFKDQHEIELLRVAAQKSAKAHVAAMQKCQPGMWEYQLESIINYELMEQGCRTSAYPAIVGGGKNACTLHYVDNAAQLVDGELVLIDAGGEYENYAADITRTFPINGKFTPAQSQIYNLVLKTQQKVIDLIRPGIPFNQLQESAVTTLTEGLIELGILSGSLAQELEKKSYLKFYMHNISHWLGLDVHDAGSYKKNDEWRRLEASMVLTVEPGLYLSPNEELDKKWWNIGVRIEDDVLVTSKGCEVLSASLPKTVPEIEKIMAVARRSD